MKSIQNALVAYSASKFILACGTAVMLFSVGNSFFPGLPDWLSTLIGIAVAFLGVAALDGGWDYLEDLGRADNGQDNVTLTKAQKGIFLSLGLLGVIGSILVSILAAPVLSGAVVEDKSGIASEMDATKEKGDGAYLKVSAQAEQNVARAEKALQAAQSELAGAEMAAVNEIGGSFAKDWKNGNHWVRTDPSTAGYRKRIKEAKAAAQKRVDSAQKAKELAEAAYADVLTTGFTASTATTSVVLEGQGVVLDNWKTSLSRTANFFVRVDLFAGLLASLICFLLYKTKQLPNERTVLELTVKIVKLTGEAFVYALGAGVDAAETSMKGHGIVAHPLPGMPVPAGLPAAPLLPESAPPVILSLAEGKELERLLLVELGKSIAANDDVLSERIRAELDKLARKMDAFVQSSAGQCGQTGACGTKTNRTKNVRHRAGQTGQKSSAHLSWLSATERARYVRYKNRLIKGKLGPKAKAWFDSVSKNLN
jgi:hypothetical protein